MKKLKTIPNGNAVLEAICIEDDIVFVNYIFSIDNCSGSEIVYF